MFFSRLSKLAFVLLFGSAFFPTEFCFAQAGQWDAQLDSPGGPIRFGLHIKYEGKGNWIAWLRNGQERIDVPEIVDQRVDNTIQLNIDHYESQLNVKLVPGTVSGTDSSEKRLVGTWKKRRGPKKWVEMDFSAVPRTESELRARELKFDGRWRVKFSSSEEPAVGIFKSTEKGKLAGTFLTTTGDYRFLAGSDNEKEMELSCFDGAHAFLFKAKLQDDGSLTGDFWSSKHWHETWTAVRDEEAKLPDSFELTKATKENINGLAFPDLDGKETKLDDKRFSAPVRIVHIFGSWCPNCHDAGVYLSELKQKYEDKISVVGVAFELTGDFERDAAQVRKYLSRHKLDHSVLIGGKSSKTEASKVMTFIDEVRSYPTTIFADSTGEIIGVHQGFSGPATGESYVELKKKFESVIEGILKR